MLRWSRITGYEKAIFLRLNKYGSCICSVEQCSVGGELARVRTLSFTGKK